MRVRRVQPKEADPMTAKVTQELRYKLETLQDAARTKQGMVDRSIATSAYYRGWADGVEAARRLVELCR